MNKLSVKNFLQHSFFCVFVAVAMPYVSTADVRLPGIFESNMVLQRDIPLHFWGWASPNEVVTVLLNGRKVDVKTGKDGRWSCTLPAMQAGGPFDVTVRARNEIVLKNVLIGDLWICGGQSNMQWRLDQTGYVEKDSAFIKDAQIRLVTINIEMDYKPKDDVKSTGWKTLTTQNINEFSAVAYHFGKSIYTDQKIPVGLISDNLGATAIETWMSNDALMKFPQFSEVMEPITRLNKSFSELNAAFEKTKSKWYNNYYYKGKGIDEQWFKPATNTSDWKPIKASGNTWEGETDLKDFDGEVWFRTTFDLPENYAEENFYIALSQIDDYDIAWVNGTKIGESFGKHNHRGYNAPRNILKAKGNVLVVRVFDVGGIGGFTTSPFWGGKILSGDWLYKKGTAINAAKFPKPEVPSATPFSSPGVLFNGIIAPLTALPIKGAIWYQGESNVERAYEYRELFPAMINDWRKKWNQKDLPFVFVQLANHLEESAMPGESIWAELREAQTMTLALHNTAMAAAIDIGEANDIHPKNKQEVGRRLAIAALKVAYGKNLVASGPAFKTMTVKENHAIIDFNFAGNGLVTKDKYGYVRGYQIAGEDRKFYWAKAKIEGSTVVVGSDQVMKPVAVRYAWDNNPGPLDLYNHEGLPALPFRTDTWKGITGDKVFVEGPRF